MSSLFIKLSAKFSAEKTLTEAKKAFDLLDHDGEMSEVTFSKICDVDFRPSKLSVESIHVTGDQLELSLQAPASYEIELLHDALATMGLVSAEGTIFNDQVLEEWRFSWPESNGQPKTVANARESARHLSLDDAIQRGTLDVIATILKKEPVPTQAKLEDAARLAIYYRDRSVIELLIKHGFVPKRRTLETALTYSEINTRLLEIVKALIEAGVDVNVDLGGGERPLMGATDVDTKSMRLIKYLVSKGADVNLGTKRWGKTPLHSALLSITSSASEKGRRAAIVGFLLENGADPDAKTVDGEDAASMARKMCAIP